MSAEIIREMMGRYEIQDRDDALKALREVVQELVLFSLHRANFFDTAVFYGGTALRILHGLDRFSEDLDFALRREIRDFSFRTFEHALIDNLKEFSLAASFETREPEVSPGGIAESHVRTGPVRTVLSAEVSEDNDVLKRVAALFPSNQIVKIKLEADTRNARSFEEESSFPLSPIPFPLRTMTLPSMFAGKMHALLCRQWGARIKGRDWYDCLWFVKKNISLDMLFLEDKLRDSGHWQEKRPFGEDDFKSLFAARAASVDIEAARNDVRPFLRDPRALSFWSNELFASLVERFRFSKHPSAKD